MEYEFACAFAKYLPPAMIPSMRATQCINLLIAAIFSMPSALPATIETVPVGNPHNPPDTRFNGAGFGAVAYPYRIGKYEVTCAQYAEFLNAVDPSGANTLGLFHNRMQSDGAGAIMVLNSNAPNGLKYDTFVGRQQIPINWISWFDALRFANWLHNGQGAGDTETGAYTLLGGTEVPSNVNTIARNEGARWFLPTENEWYKAAYHKNDGATGNYWNYPTSFDAQPYSDQPPGSDAPNPANTANTYNDDGIANGYDDGWAVSGQPRSVSWWTDVGAYSKSVSPYGTRDQGGNLWEYNEYHDGAVSTIVRGGSWGDYVPDLHANHRLIAPFMSEGGSFGFRVATIAVPEPALGTLTLLAVSAVAYLQRLRIPLSPTREGKRKLAAWMVPIASCNA
jgi:sulfatase modifying factor 1